VDVAATALESCLASHVVSFAFFVLIITTRLVVRLVPLTNLIYYMQKTKLRE
jgi:hypothetical protein